jgi:hypothetical protein
MCCRMLDYLCVRDHLLSFRTVMPLGPENPVAEERERRES